MSVFTQRLIFRTDFLVHDLCKKILTHLGRLSPILLSVPLDDYVLIEKYQLLLYFLLEARFSKKGLLPKYAINLVLKN